jgi:hypothetical protein
VKDCQQTRRRLQPTTGLAIPGPEEPQLKAWCDEHERFSAFVEARLYPGPAKPSHYDVGEGELELFLELDLTRTTTRSPTRRSFRILYF